MTAFVDTSGLEKVEYHYALQALDEAGLASEPAVIQLAKLYTGIRKPLTPLRFVYDTKAKTIQIFWPLPKQQVKKYILYRQTLSDTKMTAYQYFEGKFGNFLDLKIKPNQPYIYRLMAILADDSETALSQEFTAILEQ